MKTHAEKAKATNRAALKIAQRAKTLAIVHLGVILATGQLGKRALSKTVRAVTSATGQRAGMATSTTGHAAILVTAHHGAISMTSLAVSKIAHAVISAIGRNATSKPVQGATLAIAHQDKAAISLNAVRAHPCGKRSLAKSKPISPRLTPLY